MCGNSNLVEAKKNKNDEFYTKIEDIEKELINYKDKLKGKIIYCNCDNPEYSNFWKYFYDNFGDLKIKKLISTYYNKKGESYKTVYDGKRIIKEKLSGDGDFSSEECIEILKEADLIITNPPFSVTREKYIPLLFEYEKKFLIIGDDNLGSCKNIFYLFKDNKIWKGYNHVKSFLQPDGTEKRFGNKSWFTNLDNDIRHKEFVSLKKFDENNYNKYENYDAINIDKLADIPCDYDEAMGVPITFLDKYCPEQFEIIDLGTGGICTFTNNRRMEALNEKGEGTGKIFNNAKGNLYRKHLDTDKKPAAFKDIETGELYQTVYSRFIIKRKKK